MKDDPIPRRADYAHFLRIQTRWMDNDVYGHVNNVVFYSYFDTIINRFLVHEGGLDIHDGPVIGLCVESQCRYLAPAAFPEELDAGLATTKLGNTSVRYAIALFKDGKDTPCACGSFVHVFVDRQTRKAVPIPADLRTVLRALAPPT